MPVNWCRRITKVRKKSFVNKATQGCHFDIPALPCLRFESETGKTMPTFFPENPVSIGDHIKKKRMELKLLQREVASICGVTEDCITNWKKNRNTPQIQCFPNIINFLGYMPFYVDLTTLSGS